MAKTNKDGGPINEPLKIWYLIDRSGSMVGLHEAVVSGTNNLLAEQRGGRDECRISIAQFDDQDPFELIVDDEVIDDVKPLTGSEYQPRGLTPLYDAIAALIKHADKRIKKRREAGLEEEDQLVVIFTDGLENASTDYDRQRTFEKLRERQERGWTFAFLGANQDAYAEGGKIGVARGSTANFRATPEGVGSASRMIRTGITAHRQRSRRDRRRHSEVFFENAPQPSEPDTPQRKQS